MSTIAFHTLGCKVNQYDTEAMRESFERAGWTAVDFEGEADVYLINTCTCLLYTSESRCCAGRWLGRVGRCQSAGGLRLEQPRCQNLRGTARYRTEGVENKRPFDGSNFCVLDLVIIPII